MRIAEWINGAMTYRDATAEEIAEAERMSVFDNRSYEQRVEDYIRERYSVSDELALLRQRDTKQEEFEIYNSFAEFCKERARIETSDAIK